MANEILNLKNSIQNCNLCKLRDRNEELRNLDPNSIDYTYGKPVPGLGSSTAKIMIFGEAPGADEVLKGKPFIGKAGSLLRDCLESVGVQPSMVYIANVINCRPPENKFPTGVAGDEIVKTCLPWARKQIAAIRPKVIIGLGSQPLKYIYQAREKLSEVYGKRFDWHINAINLDTIYIPSLHPSFCLRPGRTYSEVLKDELSDGQVMMTLSISEKKDLLRSHIELAYQIVNDLNEEDDKTVEVISIRQTPPKWQDNDNFVYIGRAGKGFDGYFGNPITVDTVCPLCKNIHISKEDTIPCYRLYFNDRVDKDPIFKERILSLKSKKLVCFCAPNNCHGDVIAEYINNMR